MRLAGINIALFWKIVLIQEVFTFGQSAYMEKRIMSVSCSGEITMQGHRKKRKVTAERN